MDGPPPPYICGYSAETAVTTSGVQSIRQRERIQKAQQPVKSGCGLASRGFGKRELQSHSVGSSPESDPQVKQTLYLQLHANPQVEKGCSQPSLS